MNEDTYFFVDGSCLLGDIARIKQADKSIGNKKLCLSKFYRHFTGGKYSHLTGGSYRRFTVYSVNGENRIKQQLIKPDFKEPNKIEDFHIRLCGKKISKTKRIDDWLQKVSPPQYVMERFSKSEKAVDTQICCDALQLAANNRLDRLFLYTNDYDFMPLLEVLKSLGVNVSMFRLTSKLVNIELVENSDSFCVPEASILKNMFP